MVEYVLQRRSLIAEYVATRPLLQACKDGELLCGTPHGLWWWEQEFSLDKVEGHSTHSNDSNDTSQN